ncbi:MAG: 50S ribosomal protein L17 [Victivallaceae bacterium]|nr:50S ribosomal protein L17 [Victivallaceae bacterium]
MRHRVKTFKIGRTSSHRTAMMANMVSSLLENGQITTTLVKGKEAARVTDKMITLGKKGSLHHRRLAVSRLRNKDAVKHLFDNVAPSFAGREGGYTRVIKLGCRQGDAAEMCLVQLVTVPAADAKKAKTAAPVVNAEVVEEKKAEEAK